MPDKSTGNHKKSPPVLQEKSEFVNLVLKTQKCIAMSVPFWYNMGTNVLFAEV